MNCAENTLKLSWVCAKNGKMVLIANSCALCEGSCLIFGQFVKTLDWEDEFMANLLAASALIPVALRPLASVFTTISIVLNCDFTSHAINLDLVEQSGPHNYHWQQNIADCQFPDKPVSDVTMNTRNQNLNKNSELLLLVEITESNLYLLSKVPAANVVIVCIMTWIIVLQIMVTSPGVSWTDSIF